MCENMNKYSDDILATAKTTYQKGMRVKSPMTGKEFTVDTISGTWHKEYIKGFDGKIFFDVVWYRGNWAKVILHNKTNAADTKSRAAD